MAENTLYFGENLKILRDNIRDGTVDLIYLDPPFNSKARTEITAQPSRQLTTACTQPPTRQFSSSNNGSGGRVMPGVGRHDVNLNEK